MKTHLRVSFTAEWAVSIRHDPVGAHPSKEFTARFTARQGSWQLICLTDAVRGRGAVSRIELKLIHARKW